MQGFFIWSLCPCLFTSILCPVPCVADVLDEDFVFGRDIQPGQNLREWQRDFIGLPGQRKTSNCDVSVQNRPQQGREAEGAHSSFCDRSVSASLKG